LSFSQASFSLIKGDTGVSSRGKEIRPRVIDQGSIVIICTVFQKIGCSTVGPIPRAVALRQQSSQLRPFDMGTRQIQDMFLGKRPYFQDHTRKLNTDRTRPSKRIANSHAFEYFRRVGTRCV
jgi:hypothetical protein